MAAAVTAQQIKDAQDAGIQELVTALLVVNHTVNQMENAEIGGFRLWNGGLPQDVRTPGGQSFFYARQLAQTFGLPFEEPGSPAPAAAQS